MLFPEIGVLSILLILSRLPSLRPVRTWLLRVIGAEQEIGNAFFQRGQPQHQFIMDGGKNSK
jgi:hypothetical protein